jgi:TonB family protein
VFRKEVRAVLVGAFVLIFFTVLMVMTMPKGPETELNPPQMDQNRFTKMIVDAETIKKRRDEARERQSRMIAKAGGQTNEAQKPQSSPIQSKGAAPKVIGKLKMEGLSALLGKISKRASDNSAKIMARGVAADTPGAAGVMPAAAGTLQGVATTAGNAGEIFKVGAVATLGKGGGASVKGTGGLALGGAGSASVGILDEETEIEGGLDKDVIAKVINAHLGEIRYCYERQLSAEPDIYGKVIVKFSIGAKGLVETQRVGNSSLRNAMVEGCILRRIASWKFPQPKGGTEVLVTYPFLFKSTN